MGTGLVHIYTGEGKGKTTAAVGLAVRALGHGIKVLYLYFNKQPGLYGYNEIQNLKQLGAKIYGFSDQNQTKEAKDDCFINGFSQLTDLVINENPGLLILDEILISVQFGLIDEQEILDFITSKPSHLEIVLTGRGASDGLIEIADYVSDIRKVKHPYDRRIYGRVGIEY